MLVSSKRFVPSATSAKKRGPRNVITKSGQQIPFDTDQIQQLVNVLWQVKDQPIDKLTVQDKQALASLKSYSQLLQDDPELDNTIRQIINSKFKDLHSPLPGTPGAWAVGCLRAPRGPDQQCHILCANSMPCPQDDPNCVPCDKSVYLAQWADGKYTLIEQSETPSNDVWVWLIGPDQRFHGFDLHERQIMGVKKNVTIKTYNPQTQQVTDIKKTTLDDPSISREKMNSATLSAPVSRQTEVVVSQNKNTSWILLLLVLIVIVVVGYFLWKK